MTEENSLNQWTNGNGNKVWIGVGVGAAIGVAALVLSRRRRDPWYSAKGVTRRVADHSADLAACSKDIVERVRVIYNESRKLVEEATELFAQGRKLVGV